MTLREMRLLFGGAVAAVWFVLMMSSGSPRTYGVSASWSDSGYHVAGGTDPVMLGSAGLMVFLYVLLMRAEPVKAAPILPGVLRRFVAFWVDWMISMMTIAPVVGVLPLVVEWRRTGVFEWTFERSAIAAGDTLVVWLSFGLLAIGMAGYFTVPLLRQRPSPGACILGYQVVPDEGTNLTVRAALLRVLAGFPAASAPYLAPFVGRDKKKGKIWIDLISQTHATRF